MLQASLYGKPVLVLGQGDLRVHKCRYGLKPVYATAGICYVSVHIFISDA